MAKNKISEWSSTPANNTDVGGIDIAEGCAPSGINNAIREMMAQIKDQQAGTDADSFTVGGNLAVTGTSSFTGAASFAGATNVTGNVNALGSNFIVYPSSTTTNVTYCYLGLSGTSTRVVATKDGTGTYGDLQLWTNGTQKFTIAADATGTYTFGGTAPRITGDFTNATLASRVAIQTSTANSTTVVGVLPSGTGTVSSINLFGNSDTTGNSPYTILSQTGGKTRLEAGRIGTGTYGDMEFWSSGSKQLWIDTTQGVNTRGPLNVGYGTGSGADASIEIAGGRSADGTTFIDFHSSVGTDYDFRIIRNSGVNASAQLMNSGTSAIQIIANTNGVQLTNGATSWAAISDETKKDIIEPITNGVNKVATLRSVIGKYKTEDNARRSFLIAQDVQKVLPEAVVEVDGVLNLAYTDVIPLLVSAINELSARVKELESK